MSETTRLVNPYKGLKSFEEKDATYFFGREKLVAELLNKILDQRFLAVLGASGTGKSSLIEAGLIPEITKSTTAHGSQWHKMFFRIGLDPMLNLARSLSQLSILQENQEEIEAQRWENVIKVKLKRSEQALSTLLTSHSENKQDQFLIVVDQFEEIFQLQSQSQDQYEQAVEFFKLLSYAVREQSNRIYLVIIIRSDFIEACHQLPGLVALLNESHYVIPKMEREDVKRAIMEPALSLNASFSKSLSTRILNDLASQNDQLPVLQHTLMRVWDFHYQKNKAALTIDLPAYEAIGGVERSLELHLEEIYHSLDSTEKKTIAEKLFKTITEKPDGKAPIRKPTSFRNLQELIGCKSAVLKEVIQTFSGEGKSFLSVHNQQLITDDSIIDITHESIMLFWKRLRRWIEEEADSMKVYLDLCQAAKLYHEGKVGVLTNPQLDSSLYWYEHNKPTEGWGNQYDNSFHRAISFLEFSKKEHDFAIAYKAKRQKKKLKNARRLAVVMGLLSMVSIILFIYAIIARVETEKNAAIAIAEKERAETQKERAEQMRFEADDQRQRAELNATKALKQRKVAEANREKAEEERIKAQKNAEEALHQELIALTNEQEALKQKGIAEAEKANAIQQREIAEEERKKAEALKKLADSAKERADSLRMISVGRALAVRSSRIERQRQKDLKAALAVQGYTFNTQFGGSNYDPEIYDALLLSQYASEPVKGRRTDINKPIISIDVFEESGQFVYSTEEGKIGIRDISSNGAFNDTPTELKNCKTQNCEVTKFKQLASKKQLLTGYANGTVKLWDTKNRNLIASSNGSFMGNSKILALSVNEANVLAMSEAGTIQELAIVGNKLSIKGTFDFMNRINDAILLKDKAYVLSLSKELTLFDWATQESQVIANNVVRITQNNNSVYALKADGEIIAIGEQQAKPLLKLAHLLANASYFQIEGNFIMLKSKNAVAIYPTQYPNNKPLIIELNESPIIHSLLVQNGTFVLLATEDRELLTFPTNTARMATESCSVLSESITKEEWEQYVGFDIPYQETCKGL